VIAGNRRTAERDAIVSRALSACIAAKQQAARNKDHFTYIQY
jgi:hypothetical protein